MHSGSQHGPRALHPGFPSLTVPTVPAEWLDLQLLQAREESQVEPAGTLFPDCVTDSAQTSDRAWSRLQGALCPQGHYSTQFSERRPKPSSSNLPPLVWGFIKSFLTQDAALCCQKASLATSREPLKPAFSLCPLAGLCHWTRCQLSTRMTSRKQNVPLRKRPQQSGLQISKSFCNKPGFLVSSV